MKRRNFVKGGLIASIATIIPIHRYTVDEWCKKHGVSLAFGEFDGCEVKAPGVAVRNGLTIANATLSMKGYYPHRMVRAQKMDDAFKALAKAKLIGRTVRFSRMEPIPMGEASATEVYFPAHLTA